MTITLPPPQPRQKEVLKDTHRHVAFGGARGGGKSWFVRIKAILLCLMFAGIKTLIVRKTYEELEKNHVIYLIPLIVNTGLAKYNATKHTFIFKNGSIIQLGYCRNDADAHQYQGQEYDVIFFDEATQLTEYQIKMIIACNRGPNPNFPKRCYYTCNPGGPGHQYIKRLFIDRNFNENERPEDYSFIQSKVTDNKILLQDETYVNQLKALPPKLRKAWLDGEWDIFEGQFFEEFVDDPEHYKDRKYTHVIEPFEIPRDWQIFRSYDHGYAKPFSVGWWAVDYDGRVYRILEMYGCTDTPDEGVKWTSDKVFSKVAEIERTHRWLKDKNIIGVADPAIWQNDGGVSIADTAAKYNILFNPADNSRIPGWMQFHYRLAFDEFGIPMCYIFNNCKSFIRTIPLLMYDETVPEDLDTKLEDHIADESRYLFMMNPISIPAKTAVKVPAFDPLNQYSDQQRYGSYFY